MGDLMMMWIGIVVILVFAAYSAIVTKIAVDFYQDYCKLEKKFYEMRKERDQELANASWLSGCLRGAKERGNAMEDKLGKQLRESQERVELLEGALGAIEQMSREATSLFADRANFERNERDDDGEAKV
jgi:hypothetical protein